MAQPIVVAVDSSEKTKALLDAAVAFAKVMAAPVTVIHLRELETYGLGGVVWDGAGEPAPGVVEEAVSRLRDSGLDATGITGSVADGAIATAIAQYAKEVDAQAIIVGTKSHSPSRSTSHRLLHLIDRPLIAIP